MSSINNYSNLNNNVYTNSPLGTMQTSSSALDSENPLTPAHWNELDNAGKLALLDEYAGKDASEFEAVFQYSKALEADASPELKELRQALSEFMEANGYFVKESENSETGGVALGKFDADLFAMKGILEDAGFEMVLDKNNLDKAVITIGGSTITLPVEYDDNGAILNSGGMLTKEKFAALTSEEQDAVFKLWNLHPAVGKLMTDDLALQLQMKSLGNLEVTERDLELPPALPRPSGKVTSLLDFFGSSDGKLAGNVTLWSFGLMSMVNNIQSAQTAHIAATMDISMRKDEYFFTKAKILNRKMYETIAAENKRLIDARNNDKGKKNAWERTKSIFKSMFTGKIREAVTESISLIHDCTVGMVTRLLGAAMTGISCLAFMAVKSHFERSGATEQVKMLDNMIDEMKKSAKEQAMDAITGSKQYYDKEGMLNSMAESQALEDEINNITAEEAQYISLYDIGAVNMANEAMQLHAGELGDAASGLNMAVGMLVSSTVGFIMGGFLGAGLGMFSTVMNADQADQVRMANTYAVESKQQSAYLNYRSQLVNAAKEAVDAYRGELSAEMQVLGKDLKEMLAFLSTMEDLVNDIVSTAMEIQKDAARLASN